MDVVRNLTGVFQLSKLNVIFQHTSIKKMSNSNSASNRLGLAGSNLRMLDVNSVISMLAHTVISMSAHAVIIMLAHIVFNMLAVMNLVIIGEK